MMAPSAALCSESPMKLSATVGRRAVGVPERSVRAILCNSNSSAANARKPRHNTFDNRDCSRSPRASASGIKSNAAAPISAPAPRLARSGTSRRTRSSSATSANSPRSERALTPTTESPVATSGDTSIGRSLRAGWIARGPGAELLVPSEKNHSPLRP